MTLLRVLLLSTRDKQTVSPLLQYYEKALECYKTVVRINSNDWDAYWRLGTIYDDLELYQEAIKSYKKAISINPKEGKNYFYLGLTYLLLGDKVSARKQYEILKSLSHPTADMLLERINE